MNNVPTIVYAHDAGGNFIAVDTANKVCGYAYRTSEHAESARKNPGKVAAEMLHQERELFRTMPAPDYYWKRYQGHLADVLRIDAERLAKVANGTAQPAQTQAQALEAIQTPRGKHSHRCKACGQAVYCYEAKCQQPQRIDTCSYCR